jgi:hemoglobin
MRCAPHVFTTFSLVGLFTGPAGSHPNPAEAGSSAAPRQFWSRALAALLMLVFVSAGQALAQTSPQDRTLYERLGGLPAISLVLSDFVDVFIQDPMILANPAVRERKTPESAPYIKYQVTSLVCEATGGPCEYSGLDLREAHDGLNVSEAEWERMVEIFSETLNRHGVPEQEQQDLFAILGPTKADIVVTANP